MSQNYNQGARKAPKEPVINKWEGEGIVRPRYGKDGDEIRFMPYKKGNGGLIHISLECIQASNTADENGMPKYTRCFVPVDVFSNSRVDEQLVRSVKTGMKVHVVGKLAQQQYTNPRTNQTSYNLVVIPFMFEILDMPQAAAPQGYIPAPTGYGQQQGYGPQPGYGQQPGYAGPQGAYPAPAGGYGPQPGGYPPPSGYAAPAGGYPAPAGPAPAPGGYPAPGSYPPPGGGYPAPAGPAPVTSAPAAGQQPGYAQAPPYYKPPTPGYGASPMPAPVPGVDDMPPGAGEEIPV